MVKLKRVDEVKVIKRNLPIQGYEIVDGYSLGEDKIPCDNCNRLLTNVVTVKGQNGDIYNVGTDCAATLSGISQDDIDFWNDSFKQSKNIRSKLNKWCKQVGSKDYYFVVEYMDWGETRIVTYWKDKSDKYASFIVGNDISSLKDFVKYCPDLAKKTFINPKIEPYISDRDYDKAPKESGGYLGDYKVEYNYENGHCTATIYKNGKKLSQFSNYLYGKDPTDIELEKAFRKAAITAYLYAGNKDKDEWKPLTNIIR